MIAREVKELERQLAGKRLSSKAKRHIARQFKRHINSKLVNLKLYKSTAQELDRIIEASNITRDSFINRMLEYLNCSRALMDYLGIPQGERVTRHVPLSPLAAAEYVLADPLEELRNRMEELGEPNLYLFPFPEKLAGINCYIEDWEIPGTPENEAKMRELFEDLGGLDDAAFGNEKLAEKQTQPEGCTAINPAGSA